jgi:protein-S-isoprenylcysteine O-methyltransferase Ste14
LISVHGLDLRIPPPIVGLCIAGFMWLAARVLPMLDFPLPAREIVAASLAAAGLLIDVTGIASFIHARTTVNPLKPQATSTLVTTGVYKLTRNPMYLGMLLMLLAWAAYLANAAAIALIPIFVIYLNRFQIGPEERVLTTLFGDQFAAYRKRVRKWL